MIELGRVREEGAHADPREAGAGWPAAAAGVQEVREVRWCRRRDGHDRADHPRREAARERERGPAQVLRLRPEELRHSPGGSRPGGGGSPPGEGDPVGCEVLPPAPRVSSPAASLRGRAERECAGPRALLFWRQRAAASGCRETLLKRTRPPRFSLLSE